MDEHEDYRASFLSGVVDRAVGVRRNVKFVGLYAPLLVDYVRTQRKARRLRKATKAADPERYYEERTALWDEQHAKAAAGVKRVLEKMGGLYNKTAQDWATRDGMLPQPWVDELRTSFERMPARPWAQMERALLDGLKRNAPDPRAPAGAAGLARYFLRVDACPLAAASIGQVHAATLYSGERVIVKIVYPEIRRHMAADLINLKQAPT